MEVKATIAAVILGLFALNLLSAHHFARIDLTAQKNYTLAPATRQMLKKLDDVVTLKMYFTPDLPPTLLSLKRDVEDMLSEYKTASKNHIQVEFYNPQANPIEEQKVQMMGIPPVELNVIQKDKQEVAKIYLGMTVNFSGKQEVLAVIENTSNLEYRLDAAILKVVETKKPVIGWWGPAVQEGAAYTQEQKGNGYDMALENLKQRYEIRPIRDDKLELLNPTEIPTLLFVVPDKMEENQKQAFTDYLKKGGKAIVLVSRYGVSMEQGLRATQKENPLEEILKSYGVEVEKTMVADPSSAMTTFTGGAMTYHIPYPFWVMIRPEGFDKKEPMVAGLNSLVLAWPSPLKLSDTAMPLFQTTSQAAATAPNTMSPLDPQFAGEVLKTGQPQTMALGAMAQNRLLVVGDTSFLQNAFMQQFQQNGIFLENAVDVFSTGDNLIGVRSKGVMNQPIALISDRARALIKITDIFASPVLLLGIGAVIGWRRKQ